MGRIRTTLVKRTGEKLVAKHPDKFQGDFNQNKKDVEETAQVNSKKLRNFVAGYITSIVKKTKK